MMTGASSHLCRFHPHPNRFQAAIGRFQGFAQSAEEQYAHIDSAKKENVLKLCNESDLWLSQALSDQDRLSKSDNPVLTVDVLQGKISELTRACDPVMKTPKPKPKPVEEKPEETTEKDGAKEAAEPPAAEAAEENAKTDTRTDADGDERMATDPSALDEDMTVD